MPPDTESTQPEPPQQEPDKQRTGAQAARAGGLMGGRVIPLGRLWGIRFGVDPSWFFVFVFVTYSVGEGFGRDHQDWSAPLVWLSAILGSTLFFVSILLHELGHSAVAISLGLPVRSITLFLFGGVAELSGEPKRPRDEFLIAIAGPAVSALLSLAFLVLWLWGATGQPVAVVSMWLALVNLGVALFNMLPGFPLDGGRVFRAVLWRLFEDFERATNLAGRMGILLGNLLIAFGTVLAISSGRWLYGFFLAFMGWFLARSARSNAIQSILSTRLRSLRVKDAAEMGASHVDGWDTLEEVVEQVPEVKRGGVLVFEEGNPVGALGPLELAQISPNKYAFRAARSMMTPLAGLVRVGPGETLFSALQLMDRKSVSQLLVELDGQPLGLLNRAGLSRALNQR